MKSFLKWVGGKYRIKEKIIEYLPTGNKLIEPFCGGGSIFLNTDYHEYILGDTNADLINLFNVINEHGVEFINYAKMIFENSNSEDVYYQNRELYNTTENVYLKSALFIYLNKHCFNGLFRVNSSGKFNTPFGNYKSPKFPEIELLEFYKKSIKAEFIVSDFSETMSLAISGDVIYCDPPYSQLIQKSNFTAYTKESFGESDHFKLRYKAIELSNRNIPVVISNHDTDFTRELYKDASKIVSFEVSRNLSCKGDERKKVKELVAIYTP